MIHHIEARFNPSQYTKTVILDIVRHSDKKSLRASESGLVWEDVREDGANLRPCPTCPARRLLQPATQVPIEWQTMFG